MAMVKKTARRRTRRRWIISRDVEIQGVDISIYIEAEGTDLARLRRSMQHLEARGVLTEPLGGTTDALITIFSEAEPNVAGGEIPNVGAVLAVRPRLAAAVGLAPDEFGLLAAMMLAGRLASAHLAFQDPKYGKGLVASFSFSTQSPEIG